MFSQDEEKKLDWMYKNPTSMVDREDYLLGRAVDKTLEQLNTEEKQKQNNIVLPQPKNHVEHECIPPSIRDYKQQTGDQVDLSAKLQEDPLVAIKKREEETRRQFLQNPVQLKKLQEALLARQQKMLAKKKKKKKHSDEDLDMKIAEKLKLLKNNPLGVGLSSAGKKEKKKKKKKDNSLDTILMHKFNELKDKLSDEDLSKILRGEVSSDSDDSSENDEEEDVKNKAKKKKSEKKIKKESTEESSSDDDRRESNKYRSRSIDKHRNKEKDKRKLDSRERYSQKKFETKGSRSYSEEYKKYRSKTDWMDKESKRNRESNDGSRERRRKEDKKHERTSSVSRKKVDWHEKQSNNSRSRSRDKETSGKHCREPREQSYAKATKKQRGNTSSSDSESSSSVSDSERRKKRNFGLVKADGSKISLSSSTSKPVYEKPKPAETVTTKSYERPKPVRLSEEEKERRRKEMMENAAWREVERAKNVKRYQEKDDKDVSNEYNPDFVRKELLKSANSSSVESRVKANINKIQRSGSDMNTHFSRR